MATATLSNQAPTRKAPKAYRCTIDDEPGTLSTLDGTIYFFADDGRLVEFTVEMDGRNVCVLGEVGIAATAVLLEDTLHGGPARICTTRAMEVQ